MSRIGNALIQIPAGVKIDISQNNLVSVKGPKGVLTQEVHPDIKVSVQDDTIRIERPTDQKRHKAMHGMYRSVLANMVEGVHKGFVKELELVGVGYRISNAGNLLEISVGFSHPIMMYIPDEVKVMTKTEKGSNPTIRLESPEKQLLGQIAAKIRSLRKPEPYKGKGIKYSTEVLRRKAGKTAGK
ncbi:MAG TPA: 50S ribosomal protein L6 [Saprospiraceae bacterium]|nr:50S ribosomal protein L6 [Saprospiraceae bacterium]